MRPVAPTWSSQLTLEDRQTIVGAPWLNGLPAEVGKDMVSMAGIRRLGGGRSVARALSAANEWYGVLRGAVALCTHTPEGKRLIFSLMEPGDWFGDIPLIDCLSHEHDAQTCVDTTLLVMPRSDLVLLQQRYPRLGIALARLHYERVGQTMRMYADAVSLTLEQRVAQQVRSLARRFGVPHRGGVRIGLSLSQQDLADLLGASRQRVNSSLKNLERQGQISIEPDGIVVLAEKPITGALTDARGGGHLVAVQDALSTRVSSADSEAASILHSQGSPLSASVVN
jgi:CRP/FNR family transcriptional regulator, cyclic AMP receptor protein